MKYLPQKYFGIVLQVIAILILIFGISIISESHNCFTINDFIKSQNYHILVTNNHETGNKDYYITDNIDLHGKTIYLMPNTNLVFQAGMISNGILVGDSTILSGGRKDIFDNIILKGNWKITDIATDLFKTIDINTLSNISNLISDTEYNIITINDDCICPIKQWSSDFIIRSNSKLILNANIHTLPTNYKGGYCIMLNGNNITISGNNHYLYGTIKNPKQKHCYEWLHGVMISDTCNNICIKDLNIQSFCGDGIETRGSNVKISNINSEYNGRQGLSITKGENILIQNSKFASTGRIRISSGGGPGAGIDIEPNDGDRVESIIIQNCVLKNNFRYMKNHVNDLEIYKTDSAKIIIRNCVLSGIYLGHCSNILIENCKDIKSIFKIDQNISNILLSKSGNPTYYTNGN